MTNARFCIIPARALGDTRLTRADFMVLNALGLYGDTSGWCFPSVDTIAHKANVEQVSVRRAIAKLKECGYVEVRPRFREDGSQTSNEYRILFDAPGQQGEMDLAGQEDTPHAGEIDPPIIGDIPPISPQGKGGGVPVIPLINDPSKSSDVEARDAKAGKIYRWMETHFNAPWILVMAPIYAWLEWGADFQMDIKPAAERYKRKKPDKPPRSLAWLDEDIQRNIEQRTKKKPEAGNGESGYRKSGNTGGKPLSGFGVRLKQHDGVPS